VLGKVGESSRSAKNWTRTNTEKTRQNKNRRGQFDLEEIAVTNFPEFAGCRFGHLQGEDFHVIAAAKDADILLCGNTVVGAEPVCILVYDNRIKKQLPQLLQRLAGKRV